MGRHSWAQARLQSALQFRTAPRSVLSPTLPGLLPAPSRQVLSYFALDSQSAWAMLGLQCAFFFAFLLLAWGALAAREALPRWRAAIAGRCWGQRRQRASPGGCTHASNPRPAQPVVLSVPVKTVQSSACV